MCGIAGIFSINGSRVDPNVLNTMRDSMRHRGPDGFDSWISNDGKCGLGHRRLSIIDLTSAGTQPMSNEDGSIMIVFNGEIYNHYTLRREIEKKGHQYHSHTDTETIIHLYEEKGSDVVQYLDGMFAFAIYDNKRNEIFLARDRFGKKPLYYTEVDGKFIFASEIKALLQYPGIQTELDEAALSLYLNFLAVPAPNTLFKGIKKLACGHSMTVTANGIIHEKQFYDHKALFKAKESLNETAIENELFGLLENAVKKRMMSDVPFGVFLSGGVDSSTNVALMDQLSNMPVETFSVAIKNDEISDELQYSRQVAELFKTNHHEVTIDDNDFFDLFENLAYIQDEPLADPVCVPLYYVSKLARQNNVTVVQLGEGSDEIFGGYSHYPSNIRQQKRMELYTAVVPSILKNLVGKTVGKFAPDDRVREMAARSLIGNGYYALGSSAAFFDEQIEEMVPDGLFPFEQRPGLDYVHNLMIDLKKISNEKQSDSDRRLNQYVYQELVFRIPELLLMRLDKILMANGIEGRTPFLDKDLVEFACSLPYEYKIRNGHGKYILKKTMERMLPDEILYRKKMGFCGSSANMFSNEIKKYAFHVLVEENTLKDWVDVDYIRRIFTEHSYGQSGNSLRIWTLFNLALWRKTWF